MMMEEILKQRSELVIKLEELDREIIKIRREELFNRLGLYEGVVIKLENTIGVLTHIYIKPEVSHIEYGWKKVKMNGELFRFETHVWMDEARLEILGKYDEATIKDVVKNARCKEDIKNG